MKTDMLMPQMGESIAEAKIIKWLKNPGEAVKKDEVILEISTDKVDSEIPAPAAGVLSEVLFHEGDVVPVKAKIAVIDAEDGAQDSPAESKDSARAKTAPHREALPAGGKARVYSPLVMSLASAEGISMQELETIPGSGQGARVTKRDLQDYLEARKSRHGRPGAQLAACQAPAAPAPSASMAIGPSILDRLSIGWDEDGKKVIPMDNMRQIIAERMQRAKTISPHAYSLQEVDLSAVSKWKDAHREDFEKNHGIKLTLTPFFLQAVVRALLRFPYINSCIEGSHIVLKKDINLGCAVSTGDAHSGFGLIVPVIKNAEEKDLSALALALHDLAARARSKKLLPDEASGGTFTVTNPGIFGTTLGVPIINYPQTAILAVGKVVKRPVVVNDMIAIHEMCYLTLSYDHRLIDGSLGGMFLAEIQNYLEGWGAGSTN